jgi:hypothetical protein
MGRGSRGFTYPRWKLQYSAPWQHHGWEEEDISTCMLFLVRPIKGANITVTMFITVVITIRIIHTVDQICHVQEGLLNNYKLQGQAVG